MQIFNGNEMIRDSLFHLYTHLENNYGKEEAEGKYHEVLNEIKIQNSNFYEKVMGLFFLDCYRYCLYQKKLGYENETSRNVIEISQTIGERDDLWFTIEENPDFYSTLVTFSHFYKKRLSPVMKAHMLQTIPQSYSQEFSKFHNLEWMSYFHSITIDDLIAIYDSAKKDNVDEGIHAMLEKLHVLSIGNISNYVQLILTMVKECYIWKKGLQYLYPDILFDLDRRIIALVETMPLNNLAYLFYQEEDLLMVVLEDYIFYHMNMTDCQEMSYTKALEIYHNHVSKDIKTKLKEI